MRPHDASNRMFGIAVLISIVVHAVLLVSFPGLRESRKATVFPGPLTARLVEPRAAPAPAPPAPKLDETRKPAPEPPKPAVQEAPQPKIEPPPAPVAKPAPAPVAKRAPEPKPEPRPAPAASPAAAAPSKPAAEPAQTASAAPAAPASAAPKTAPGPVARVDPQPAAPAPSTEDAGTLEQFRVRIIQAAGRYKRYPRVAMDNNWEGRVGVRIQFNAEGRRASISVASSSGHEVLDKVALDMITKAFVPVPPALRGREFTIDIPVIFNLKEASG
jgi:protein TonB